MRLPPFSHRQNLFINQTGVVKESLRMSIGVPVSLTRVLCADMDIDGISVPAGVELFPQPKLFATKYLIDRRWDGNVLHSDEQGYLSGARGFQP